MAQLDKPKQIYLMRGQFALVDAEDYGRLFQFDWLLNSRGYVVRTEGSRTIYLHREVLGTPPGMSTDHISHNTLDNRKSNLRVCSQSQNCANSNLSKNNTSGFNGVSWDKRAKKWGASIMVNRKAIFLGYFDDFIKAVVARVDANECYFGEFAR